MQCWCEFKQPLCRTTWQHLPRYKKQFLLAQQFSLPRSYLTFTGTYEINMNIHCSTCDDSKTAAKPT